MFTTSSIIDNLNHSEGLEYKKLCKSLKITKKSDKDKLDIALTALEKLEIEPPVRAPRRLAKTSAEEDPKKTASGLFEVPLIVKVASCVLSPNSAIKTVKNVESNKLKTIYK